MLTNKQINQWVENYAKRIADNKAYLTLLDARIGDADHGTNMDRGFKKVMEKRSHDGSDAQSIFKNTGMTLVSSVGGAAGPLYGTLFMEAGKAVGAKEELDNEDLVALFEGALAGVKRRGKAKAGQKTMIDALEPALKALQEAVSDDADMESAVKQAAEAAYQGMKDTIPMVAEKGRASYLGERSKGHQDPGATSTFLLFQALHDVLSSEQIEWQLEEAADVTMEDVEQTEAAIEEGEEEA